MMRKLLGLLFVAVVFFVSACTQNSAPSPSAVHPSYSEFALDRYPLIAEKRAMTEEDAVKFELTRGKLERDVWAFNHKRGLCRGKGRPCGELELLKAGTEVAVDKNGRPWYKWDCFNRLYMPVSPGPPGAGGGNGGGSNRLPSGSWLPLLGSLGLAGLFGLLGLLRRREEEEPLSPRPGNGGGNGYGRSDPDLLGPAPPVDPTAARRVALQQEVADQNAAAERHEAEAARLSQEGRTAMDDAEAEQKLRAAHDERQAAVAAREVAAAKQAELVALGPPPPAPAPTPPPAPAPAPPNDKAELLASLRTTEQKAGIRHRALRVAIDVLEQDAMTPEEVRVWLGKLGITLS